MQFYKTVLLASLIGMTLLFGCSKALLDELVTVGKEIRNPSEKCKEIRTPHDVKRFSRPTVRYLASAIRNLATASQQVFEAAELKKDADRMALIQEKLRRNPDILENEEQLKEIFTEVNMAMEKISQMDYEAKFNKKKARKNVGLASLHFSIAGFYDIRAEKYTVSFINCTTATANRIIANPKEAKKYGKLLSSIKDYMKFTTFVIANIQKQVAHTKSISSNLIAYAQKNKVDMPSNAELEAEKEKYEPDIDSSDLLGEAD